MENYYVFIFAGVRVKEENVSEKEDVDYYVANLENPYFVKKFRPSYKEQMVKFRPIFLNIYIYNFILFDTDYFEP